LKKASALNPEEGITLLDALRFSVNSQKLLGETAADIAGVSHGEWLRTVFGQLQRPESIAKVKTSRAFAARLRHYQQDGLNWLFYLHKMRLGACLADDMGLCKRAKIEQR
jgi:non-specific serine/threonine protein kinase